MGFWRLEQKAIQACTWGMGFKAARIQDQESRFRFNGLGSPLQGLGGNC